MDNPILESLTGHTCEIDAEGVCTAEHHAHATLYAAGWAQGTIATVRTLGAVLDGGLSVLPTSGQPCTLESSCTHTTCILLWCLSGIYESMATAQWKHDNPGLAAALDDALDDATT